MFKVTIPLSQLRNGNLPLITKIFRQFNGSKWPNLLCQDRRSKTDPKPPFANLFIVCRVIVLSGQFNELEIKRS